MPSLINISFSGYASLIFLSSNVAKREWMFECLFKSYSTIVQSEVGLTLKASFSVSWLRLIWLRTESGDWDWKRIGVNYQFRKCVFQVLGSLVIKRATVYLKYYWIGVCSMSSHNICKRDVSLVVGLVLQMHIPMLKIIKIHHIKFYYNASPLTAS